METRKYWNILVVDDEEDVLNVTRLSLKHEQIYGVGLKLHCVKSAKAAMELLEADALLASDFAVAIIDVVMETEHAGLDLCKFIREEKHLSAMHLILRTGQPGQAPPRKIIDEYDISTYLSKVELNEDRLYLAIKAGLQQFITNRTAGFFPWFVDELRRHNDSLESCLNRAQAIEWAYIGEWNELNLAIEAEGQYLGLGCFQDKAAYDKIIGGLRDSAQKQYQSNKLVGGLPNRIALVDGNLITETTTLARGTPATMVLGNPTLPDRAKEMYGPLFRLYLDYVAGLFAAFKDA